jgi:hypothetical protein
MAARWLIAAAALIALVAPADEALAQMTVEELRPDPREDGTFATGLPVHIRGNSELLDSVLLWVMDLPDEGPVTEQVAERAELRLRSFFRKTGYDLARVRTLVHDETLYVFVDEGKLDKIFFTGSGSGQTLRLQIEMRLPGDVYNRHRIEEELARLEDKYGLAELRAELVLLEPRPSTFFQLQDFISALEENDDDLDDVWRESRGRYALRVHVVSNGWGDGLGYGVSYLLPYGLRPHISYASTGLAVDDDRYRVSLEAAGLSNELLTHAESRLHWALPPFHEAWLRPTIDLRGRLDSPRRASLGLDDFLDLNVSAVASLGVEPVDDLVFSLGLGYGYEKIFLLERTALTPDYVTEVTRHYPLGRVSLDWLLGMRAFRRDKRHKLDVEFEMYNVAAGLVRRAELRYQNVWLFGYQDLFWRLRGTSITGEGTSWQDEEPIASPILRAVAGEESFARNMGQMGLEYRMSLYRDILKVSASGGAALVGLMDRQTREQNLDFFASFGPGIHVFFLDNFQADAYYSFGWREGWPLEGNFSFSVSKVY